MPVVVAVMMYALLLVVLMRQFRHNSVPDQQGEILRPLLVMLATGVCIFLFQPSGHDLSALIFVSPLFVVLEFWTAQPVTFALYAPIVTATFYILDAVIFGVRLTVLFGVI